MPAAITMAAVDVARQLVVRGERLAVAFFAFALTLAAAVAFGDAAAIAAGAGVLVAARIRRWGRLVFATTAAVIRAAGRRGRRVVWRGRCRFTLEHPHM